MAIVVARTAPPVTTGTMVAAMVAAGFGYPNACQATFRSEAAVALR